jgi:hypothetical protein
MQKVEPSECYWQFIIPSEKRDLKLSTQLNAPATQEEHAKSISPLGLYAGSARDNFEIFSALYELRNKGGEVENARQFIQNALRNSYPITLTRIRYNPAGQKDIIIHNFGKASKQEIEMDVVGLDMPLGQMPLELCLALTGKKPQEAEEIIKYLNQTSAYLWRINSKPSQVRERVVRLVAYSDWAYLNCYCRFLANRYPALRVGIASTEASQIKSGASA